MKDIDPRHRAVCVDILGVIFRHKYDKEPMAVAETFQICYIAVLHRMKEQLKADLDALMKAFIEGDGDVS